MPAPLETNDLTVHGTLNANVNDILPNQGGQTDNYLRTDGSSAYWSPASGGGSTTLDCGSTTTTCDGVLAGVSSTVQTATVGTGLAYSNGSLWCTVSNGQPPAMLYTWGNSYPSMGQAWYDTGSGLLYLNYQDQYGNGLQNMIDAVTANGAAVYLCKRTAATVFLETTIYAKSFSGGVYTFYLTGTTYAGTMTTGDEINIVMAPGGPTGPSGSAGSDGSSGTNGADGAPGPNQITCGSTVADGCAGMLWASSAVILSDPNVISDGSGNLQAVSVAASSYMGGAFNGDGSGVTNVAALNVNYSAGNSGDWAGGSPPPTVAAALDRIAAALTSAGWAP
jgi:hypothetical protein